MIFASGLSAPEGPVALPGGGWLVVEMGDDRGCVTRLSAGGEKHVVARTGRPNGLAIDREGVIWVAESRPPSLLRVQPGGEFDTVATGCDGEPFLFPNDLCFGPDGALYVTDSGIPVDEFAPGGKVRADHDRVEMDGRLYRVDPETGDVEKLDSGYRFTNGIAFGPDGSLYVNEMLTGWIYRYLWRGGAITGSRERFGNVVSPADSPVMRGPDGMAFGRDGHLYVTVVGQGDVTVLDRRGEVRRRIPTAGSTPTNVAFGLAGERRIYVTECERGTMEVFEVDTDGLPLFDGRSKQDSPRGAR